MQLAAMRVSLPFLFTAKIMPWTEVDKTTSLVPIVAIVDDDDSVREAVGNLLLSVGLEVCAFATAEAFLASPQAGRASCVIADVQMPGMGGLELQRRIAAGGNPVPVILITAFPRDHVCREAQELGAAACLAKPFDGGHFIECVQRALASGDLA